MSIRKITINKITLEYYADAYPLWIDISHSENGMRLHHTELVDLRDCLDRMIEQVRKDLHEGMEHEADGIK